MMKEVTSIKASKRSDFLSCSLFVCCALLTLSAFTFAMYTSKQFAALRARINELEERQLNALAQKDDIRLQYPKREWSRDYAKTTERQPKKGGNSDSGKVSPTATTKPPKTQLKTMSIHLKGGRNDHSKNATDRHLVQYWTVVHATNRMAYNAHDGSIQISIPGVYFVYSQLQLWFGKREKFYKAHETYVNVKRVLASAVGHRPSKSHDLDYDANYQGGLLRLRKGDRVFIRGQNKRGSHDSEANYFGAFLLTPSE